MCRWSRSADSFSSPAPDLLDPNFRRSVLLVGEHGEQGAMGVILNRPSPVSVADAVPPLAELVDDEELVHVGGPVQPQAIVVLGDFREPDEAAALVLGSIGFLPAEIESADDVSSLSRARVFAGYAGWAPGQLESEIEEESWIIEPALPEDRLHRGARAALEHGAHAQGRPVRRSGADAARPEPELSRNRAASCGRASQGRSAARTGLTWERNTPRTLAEPGAACTGCACRRTRETGETAKEGVSPLL